jgi:WhiB family redox-sensing transcriptional regulator
VIDDWHLHAACRGENPDLFFPQQPGYEIKVRAAKAICARCPVVVRVACAEEGLRLLDPGIRNGLTTRERERKYGVHLSYTKDEPTKPLSSLVEGDVPEDLKGMQGRFLTAEQVETVKELRADHWTLARIAALMGCSITAIRKHVTKDKAA